MIWRKQWLFLIASVALTGGIASIRAQKFDVASVKPVSQTLPGGRIIIGMLKPNGGPGTNDPGRIHYPAISMEFLLINAYQVRTFQIVGPGWLDSTFFDIEATMPPNTTKAQFRTMLQDLLTDRFKLKVHRETRESPAYLLMMAKNGPKVKESVEIHVAEDDSAPKPPERPQVGTDGYVIAPRRPGVFVEDRRDRTRLTFQQATMQGLAGALEGRLGRPVTDATGLTARYDFTLTFSRDGLPLIGLPSALPLIGPPSATSPEGEAPPDIFAALQLQLGLKLEPKKGGSLETILVIDQKSHYELARCRKCCHTANGVRNPIEGSPCKTSLRNSDADPCKMGCSTAFR